MHHVLIGLAIASALLANCIQAQELKGRKWTHKALGVQVTIPDGFGNVPLQIDEQWIVAKFLSNKTYLSKDRDWNYEHRPLMRIIAFTEKAKTGSAAEVHEEEGGTTFIGIGAVPYQGYRDYVKRHRRGFFFSKEDPGTVATQDCLMCEVDVHKSTPRLHLYSVVFHRPTFEIAIEIEVLEDRLDKLEKICKKVLKSVRFTEPAAESGAAVTGGRKTSKRLKSAFRSEWKKLSTEERYETRRQMEREHHKAARARTPPDWTITESKHFLVISHAEGKFTKKMIDGAELFYSWCEKEFGKLGNDYVRRPVLRLCRDADEYRAYHFDSSNATGWSLFGGDREIGTYYDNYNGTSGRDVSVLFGGILRHYLQEKDSYIVSFTPYWLTWALDDYLDAAIVKGRKLEFKAGDWSRDEARNMFRDGKLPPLRKILEADADAFRALRKADSRAHYAAAQAIRYILGPGKRQKAFKNFLLRYFKAAITVGEKDDKRSPTKYREAKTEAEEEAMAKTRAARNKDRRKALQQEINTLVLSQITDKDWKKLEKGYAEFVKKGK